jgi:hypothetical protein
MGEWDRRTLWRQGHVLTAETVAALRLVPEAHPASLVVVVVSHDCDLAQDHSEPIVEVIVGHRVATANGNFTHGKNPRRLHVPAVDADAAIFIELMATARRSIPKQDLAGHLPSATVSVDPAAGRNILQYWLAARYRRSAFPDTFDTYLMETGVARRLTRILEPLGSQIVAVFFDVDEGVEREHDNADDPFTLSIVLLYSTDTDPAAAEIATSTAAEAITAEFRERCFEKMTNRWRAIELLTCTPISDEALTYAMSLKLKRWNVDYISLRAEPLQPMVPE